MMLATLVMVAVLEILLLLRSPAISLGFILG